MRNNVLTEITRMNITEFDRFLSEHSTYKLVYDTTVQPNYDAMSCNIRTLCYFTDWVISVSPNVLQLKNDESAMTFYMVKAFMLLKDTDGSLYIDILYKNGLDDITQPSRLIIFTE